ncbi:hypothetical protein NBRC116587_10040 [Pseudoteredinibacter isoporae]
MTNERAALNNAKLVFILALRNIEIPFDVVTCKSSWDYYIPAPNFQKVQIIDMLLHKTQLRHTTIDNKPP